MMYFTGEFHADVGIMFEILEEIPFYSGSERQKMTRHSNKDGKMGSMCYGYTWKGFLKRDKEGNKISRKQSPYPGLYLTKVMELYPHLHDIFAEFASLHFPDFEYTSVQMNRNFPCPRHIDSKNIGESVLLNIGNYTGGELVVEYEDGDKIINNINSLYRFNGSKYHHYTLPFTGTRYALVFFKNNQVLSVIKKCQNVKSCP